MYKINLENDLKKIDDVISFKNRNKYYGRIFFKSNEYVSDILSNFDLKNKKVLTVLGSGDQAFHFLNRGAKSVDVFDINRLSIYYYYLRIWLIKYMNEFYPNDFNYEYWIKLRNMIVTNNIDETNVINFWDYFFYKDYKFNSLLEYDHYNCENGIEDLTILKNKLDSSKIKFYNFDIKSSKIKLHKKYDIVYLSNIPDWFFDFDFYNELVLFRYSNNISKLLKRKGLAIRSYVDSISGLGRYDTPIIDNYFDCCRIDSINKSNIGYYYLKK